MKLHQKLRELAASVAAEGGRLFVVGGWVRDDCLGRTSEDVDCEVHQLSSKHLLRLLNQKGSVAKVGRSFGIYKWSLDGLTVDIHLVENHSDLEKSLDVATQRRDFCCNALLFDPLSGQVMDRVGGVSDIDNGLLRVVNPKRFGEDPLRGLRGPRFVSTLGFELHEEASELCRSQDLTGLPGERVWGEVRKLLAGEFVEQGWGVLVGLGLVKQIFPCVRGLEGPEVGLRLARTRKVAPSLEDPGFTVLQFTLMTLAVPDQDLEAIFERMKLDRLSGVSLRRAVRGLRDWVQWTEEKGVEDEAILRLAEDWPVAWGAILRGVLHPVSSVEDIVSRAEELGVGEGPLPVLLVGRDLLERGVSPGPEMGRLLKKLRAMQLTSSLSSRTEALAWLEQEISAD